MADMNRLTRANLLAHAHVNIVIDDVRTLYGQAGVTLALVLTAEGLVTLNSRNGFCTLNITAAGRKAYSEDC